MTQEKKQHEKHKNDVKKTNETKEEKKHSSQKEHATPAAKTKKKKDSKKESYSLSRGVLATVFFFLGGSLIGASAFLLYITLFAKPHISELLPNEKTLALITFEDPKKWNMLQPIGVDKNILQSFQNENAPQNGIALLEIQEKLEVLFFFEHTKEEKPTELFSRGDLSCTFQEPFSLCFSNRVALQTLLNTSEEDQKLADADDYIVYKKTLLAHPTNAFMRASYLLPQFLEFLQVMESAGSQEWQKYIPLLKGQKDIFSHIILTEDINKHISVRIKRAEPIYIYAIEQKQKNVPTSQELSALLPVDTNALLTFHQGEVIFTNTFQQFESRDLAGAYAMQKDIEKELQKMFSDDILLKKDVLPLFSGYTTLATTDDGETIFLFELPSEILAKEKAKKIIGGVRMMAAKYVPQLIEHTLEDGSSVKEVFPNEDALTESRTQLSNGEVYFFESYNPDTDETLSLSIGYKDAYIAFSTGPRGLDMFQEETPKEGGSFLTTLSFPEKEGLLTTLTFATEPKNNSIPFLSLPQVRGVLYDSGEELLFEVSYE